jgi:Protein of unknown function (DUF3891)
VILRSLQTNQVAASTDTPVPAWEVIERTQRNMLGAAECWLITQPAHAALSAEIAAKLKPEAFGTMNETTVRAIALHDVGWSTSDANAIQASRSAGDKKSTKAAAVQILPFMAISANESINAWTGSVDTAEKVSPLGGFMVSEHFRSIAALPAMHAKSPELMSKFVAKEESRQKKLRPKIALADAELQRMVDGLRFCDLLSLYLCSGAQDSIEFPQKIADKNVVLKRTSHDECSLAPSPFAADEIFGISAIRHPKLPKLTDQSSARYFLKVTG